MRAARRTTALDKAGIQHEPLLTGQLHTHNLTRISDDNIIAPRASYTTGPSAGGANIHDDSWGQIT